MKTRLSVENFRARWHQYWFAPVAPDNLAVCRILFYGSFFLFYTFLPRFGDFAAWGHVSPVFWKPVWSFSVLGIPQLPVPVLLGLQEIWKAALFLSCIGLFTRMSATVSAFLGFYLLGLPQNFGKIHHYDAFLVFALVIMAMSRCGDRYSVDEWLTSVHFRGSRGTHPAPPARPPSGEYTWPVKAMWLVMSLVFFAAALAKLKHSGLDWVTGDSMSIWLVEHQYHIANTDPFTSWGPRIARIRGLPHLLAATSIGLELGYPLAMFSRRARWIFVPGVALMQLSIHALMGPTFEQQIICNLFWVPWDRVLAWTSGVRHRADGRRWKLAAHARE
jgi:hypothetical protein